ncbi:MAG: hypothetical protein GY859_03450 [Desulfobacterales bacterium]|nr:hypothetical protein [Desulfobacterales bacterium]
MYLAAFSHRDELFDIANRWLSDKLDPGDPLRIKRIVAYDSFAAWESLLLFTDKLARRLTGDAPYIKKKIVRKKDLKDFICRARGPATERVKHLIDEYRRTPEFFYIGAPMTGYIYHDSDDRMLGLCRFKRVKRIAEKASRYASMHVFEKVSEMARRISETEPPSLSSTEPTRDEIFEEAEKRVMIDVKNNGVRFPVEPMTIQDILGVKVIGGRCGEETVEAAISEPGRAKIVEKERHTGKYNAVHYGVEVTVDRDHLIRRFKTTGKKKDFVKKGLPAEGQDEDFARFIAAGADTVFVDVILTTFEELVESEIGRSMHETRIFEQRRQNRIYGNIPLNIEYIIEYLIAVGLSPTVRIDEIPIKIWGRYLPDTLSDRIRKLYRMPKYSMIGV